jgi:hypothetical protein
MKLAYGLLLAAALALAAPAFAQDMQGLSRNIKADKKKVVSQSMQLTEAEAKGFWPVYEAYEKDLIALYERQSKLIASYAEAYNKGPIPEATAKKLTDEALALEEQEAKLRRSYAGRFAKVLPAVKVLRYLQIESKIRAVVRYELAANIPLAQ